MNDFSLIVFVYILFKIGLSWCYCGWNVSYLSINDDNYAKYYYYGSEDIDNKLANYYYHTKQLIDSESTNGELKAAAMRISKIYRKYHTSKEIYLIIKASIVYDLIWFVGLIGKELFEPTLGVFKMINRMFTALNTNLASCFNNASTLTLVGFSALILFMFINVIVYLKLRKQNETTQKQLRVAFSKLLNESEN